MKTIYFLYLFCWSFYATAAEVDLKQSLLPNKRVIRITGHPDYAPVVWAKNGSQKLEGIAVEMLESIFKEANIKAEFVYVETWARAQEEVKAGRIDMLIPPYKTDERVAFYNFSTAPFMKDETVIFVEKGKEFKFKTFDDLKNYPGVAIINDSFGDDFDNFSKTNPNLTRLSTTLQCFRFVEKDRARYIVAGLNSGMAVIAKLHWEDRFTVLSKRIVATDLYAPLSLKSPWNTPEVNAFLNKKFAAYNKSKKIKELEKKYLNQLRQENIFLKETK